MASLDLSDAFHLILSTLYQFTCLSFGLISYIYGSNETYRESFRISALILRHLPNDTLVSKIPSINVLKVLKKQCIFNLKSSLSNHRRKEIDFRKASHGSYSKPCAYTQGLPSIYRDVGGCLSRY